MKKFFTLICALVGLVATGNAASISDLKKCAHSYVLVADDYNNNGTEKIAKNTLYGDGFFFTATGHDKATNKGKFDLAAQDSLGNYLYFKGKYAEYGTHLNSLRLKNAQDVLAISVTAKSKVIVCFNGQSKSGASARYPKFATDAAMKNPLNDGPTSETGTVGITTVEYTAPDDMTLYIGSWNGDLYVSYIIVEANEAAGTPIVKVGPQTFDEAKSLWFREVTVKPVTVSEESSEEEFPSIVTYTTDGTTPTAESEVVPSDPIKVYKDQTLKFQAYGDFMGDGTPDEEFKCEGADIEGIVTFSFDAPAITTENGVVTIASPYDGKGASNTIKYNDETVNGNTATLTESATVSAFTTIKNGDYATFTSKTTTQDVLLLTPIKEKKEIKVIAGEVVVDEEATTNDPEGKTHYSVEGGKLSADVKDFFIKAPVFSVVKDENAKYQVPEGQEVYLQMTGDITIYFEVADSSIVTITATKNSCKDLSSDEAKMKTFGVCLDGDTKNFKQVDDITMEHDFLDPATGEKIETLAGNVLKFYVAPGSHKITRYTGTGNIFLSSIVVEPVASDATGINEIESSDAAVKVQKVIENGKIVIVKNGVKYSVAGAQL